MGAINTYLNILGSNAGALAQISALQSLDATVKKNDASIKGLEKSYIDASTAADKAFAAGDKKGASKAAREAATIQSEIGKRAKENAAAEATAASVFSKAKATEAATQRAASVEKIKDAAIAAKSAAQQRKDAISQARDYASLVKIQRGLAEPAAKAKSAWAAFSEEAKGAGGPIGSLVGKLEGLGKGGAVGVAIAIVVALGALAVAGVAAAAAMTSYAIGAADAARSSKLFSEAATGSAKVGTELEMVVDQIANLAPGLNAKLKDVGRGLADVGIGGRDAQRVLETFGVVATARGEQAAGAIKSIAEASQTARRLMLGPFNRITGQFDSLRGTGIKSADVFKAVAKTMGTSEDAARRAVQSGLVPYRKGLEAIEEAAKMSLGQVAAKQVLSLSAQAEKLKENVSKLFSGVNIEAFLTGLKTVTDLFDQNTVTGYVLREVFTAVFTKISSLAAMAFPYIVAGIKGAVMGIIIFATAAKQAYKAITEFIGSGTQIDGIALAFKIGVGVVASMVGAVAGLTLAFVALGAVAVLALSPIWVPVALTAAFFYLIVTAIQAVIDEASSLGKEIEEIDLAGSAGKMIDGLIKGIKSKIADVKSAITEVSGAITSAFNTDQEIRSPGRKAMRQGRNVVEGQAIGMTQALPLVERASLKASGTVTGGLESGNGGKSVAPVGGASAPTFSWSNCNFYGTQTQADFEEMASMYYLKMQRGFAGQS